MASNMQNIVLCTLNKDNIRKVWRNLPDFKSMTVSPKTTYGGFLHSSWKTQLAEPRVSQKIYSGVSTITVKVLSIIRIFILSLDWIWEAFRTTLFLVQDLRRLDCTNTFGWPFRGSAYVRNLSLKDEFNYFFFWSTFFPTWNPNDSKEKMTEGGVSARTHIDILLRPKYCSKFAWKRSEAKCSTPRRESADINRRIFSQLESIKPRKSK